MEFVTSLFATQRDRREPGSIAAARSCTWCLKAGADTDDHVFPRALGGTKELKVPAHRACQDLFKGVEDRLAHRSLLGVYRVFSGGPPRRNKRDPMSGALEPDYLLVKDPLPLDGWGERAFRIGEDNPIILPSLQVDPMSGNIHCRGSRPEDVGQLVELIKSFARRAPKPGGLIGELSCDFVEAPFETDPTFWPRMYLDLRGSIRIRARNSAEAIKAVTAIVALATSGALDERRAWVGGQIRAGVEHKLRLTTVSSDELRLAAKVAYGLAFLSSATAQACADPWRSVREYVLTGQGPAPVAAVSRPGTSTHWPDRHVAAVLEMGERLAGVVWLYGGQWTVDLGEASLAGPFIGRLPIVAMSLRDGTKTGWVRDPGIAADMVSLLQGGAS